MASSPTEICNSALIKNGAERISALTDNNKRAELCNEQYNKRRKKLLSSHPWNFSTKRVQLSQLSSTPDFEFDYEYQIPSDCLRIFRVKDEGTFTYRIEGRKLLTNQTEVYIEYATDEEDTSKFPDYFSEYLAYDLAYDISYALVQSNTFRQAMKADLDDARRDAKTYDGQEGTPRSFDISAWTDARHIGASSFLGDGKHP